MLSSGVFSRGFMDNEKRQETIKNFGFGDKFGARFAQRNNMLKLSQPEEDDDDDFMME